MTGPSIKPTSTRYKGFHFRSRLEARWAVASDSLGIPWDYEPQDFQLPNGERYLPDFWLPSVNDGCWVEVKAFLDGAGCFVTDPKVQQFAEMLEDRLTTPHEGSTIFQVNGLPPVEMDSYGHSQSPKCKDKYVLSWPYDDCQDWCICDLTGKVGIQYESRSNRITPCKSPAENERRGDRGHNANHPRLIEAWTAAHSARFEFGQSGPT